MAMDPIGGLDAVVRLLRQRLATPTRARAAGEAQAPADRSSPRHDVFELRSRIAARLSGLSPEERASGRATRIFIESVLVWEFGDELFGDERLAELSSEVQRALEDAPGVGDRLTELVQSL